MSSEFFGSDWRIWWILVVWGTGLCRIGGGGRVGELRIVLRGKDGGRRFWEFV